MKGTCHGNAWVGVDVGLDALEWPPQMTSKRANRIESRYKKT